MKRTHGLSRHPLYGIWNAMIQRCTNPKSKAFKWYGGRGIGVCERWRESFMVFMEDMGPRPDGYTLERSNNELGYSPDNCHWATRKEQASNRREMESRVRYSRLTPEEASAARARHAESCRRAAAARKNPPKKCERCGGPFFRQGHEKRPPKFCSRACYFAAYANRDRAEGRFAPM